MVSHPSWCKLPETWIKHLAVLYKQSKSENTFRIPAYILKCEMNFKYSFYSGSEFSKSLVTFDACCIFNFNLYFYVNCVLTIYNCRNDANAVLYSLLTTKDDGTQNGNFEIFWFSNICCDWTQRYYNGNGILHDAQSKHTLNIMHICYKVSFNGC